MEDDELGRRKGLVALSFLATPSRTVDMMNFQFCALINQNSKKEKSCLSTMVLVYTHTTLQ